ncbi:MAG: flagellar FlbD family protein [Spirochaetia bacterium]|nr:flagellar FlbD family protein [Spirochaetia bacterium]
MIELHRLNDTVFYLNHRHIETMEALPDTVIMLTNERRYICKEKPEEIAQKIVDFNRKIFEQNFQEAVDI